MAAPKNNRNALKGARPRVRLSIMVDAGVAEAARKYGQRGEMSAVCESALKEVFGVINAEDDGGIIPQ